MSQVSLQNRDSKVLKTGDYVKFAPNTRTACVFALIGESGIIGTCAEQIYPGKWGLVNLLNTVAWADVIDVPSVSGLGEEFETVSKNLKTYPYSITCNGDDIDYITYNNGVSQIIKTFNYTLGVLTSIVLSGDTPSGINLTKTFHYTGDDLTSVSYS